MTYPINGNRGRGGLSIRQFVLHIKDWLTEALSGKQDTLEFDDAPTAGSTNPVTSTGIKTALDGMLSLSGGTMTGTISTTTSIALKRESTDGILRLTGGTVMEDGAGLYLNGSTTLGSSGVFRLRANDGSSYHDLVGSPTGQLSYANIPIARYCLPSTTYRNLTLPSSGGTVTAPEDGWVQLSKAATAAGQYIYLQTPSLRVRAFSTGANTLDIYVPVCKGDTVQVNYSAAGTLGRFRFYYSIGSEWAA